MHATTIMPTATQLRRIGPFRPKRLFVALILLTLAVAPGLLGELTRGLMVDAFTQVSAFVAATLLLFYGAERVFRFNIGEALKGAKGFQVPLAARRNARLWWRGCGCGCVFIRQRGLWCCGCDADRHDGRRRVSAYCDPP